MFAKIKRFFAEARQELRHVNWPTREEAVRLTAVVIGISAALALFLGFFDFMFAEAVKNMVAGAPASNTAIPPEAALDQKNAEVGAADGDSQGNGGSAIIEIEPKKAE